MRPESPIIHRGIKGRRRALSMVKVLDNRSPLRSAGRGWCDAVTRGPMAKPPLPEELGELIEPLLPKHEPRRQGGQPRVPDRVCLTGILFVLRTGIGWEDFLQEAGCCGLTLLNRLRQWQAAAGLWQRVRELLAAEQRAADRIDFSRVVADASFARAMHGEKNGAEPFGPQLGRLEAPPSQRERHAAGVRVDGRQRLRGHAAGAPRRVDPAGPRARPAAAGQAQARHGRPRGRLRRQPDGVSGKGIATRIARRNTEHGIGVDVFRYVVDQTIALFYKFRRLKVRDERQSRRCHPRELQEPPLLHHLLATLP